MSQHHVPEVEIAQTLSNLTISPPTISTSNKPKTKPKTNPIADSWDDEAPSNSDTDMEPSAVSTTSISSTPLPSTVPPRAPPPTPSDPHFFTYPDTIPFANNTRSAAAATTGSAGLTKRPEKTTAVAGRMIAGALGVRAPRRTAEEREYDKVMREKEKRRREEQKEREKREVADKEERKRAVWED